MTTNGNVTRVSGRELVGSSAVATTYGVIEVQLAPLVTTGGATIGLGASWLGRQASLFNKYKYLSARLVYEPFTATSTGGRIMIAYASDPNDSLPGNMTVLSQYQGSRAGPVWSEVSCNMQVGRTPEYTVASNIEEDPTKSPGYFLVATDGGASSTSAGVGALYLEYTVEFWSRAAFSTNV